MSLRSLVIGFGSLGARHARILEGLGHSVSIVSRRRLAGDRPVFASLDEALAHGSFDHAVIAVETAQHHAALTALADAGHSGSVLVEKPLFAAPALPPAHGFRAAGVGYNLRFHPAVQALSAALDNRPAEIADLYVGQWLDDWRPGRSAVTTYSALQAAGGGVLRDLSHELDLITWLFGPWQRVAALGGRLSTVTVDADDAWGIILACERCPVVTLQMNYLDRIPKRTIRIQNNGHTLAADLIANRFAGGDQPQAYAIDRDATYLALHQALLAGSGAVASLEDGLAIVELIAAIEQAARERRWIERKAV